MTVNQVYVGPSDFFSKDLNIYLVNQEPSGVKNLVQATKFEKVEGDGLAVKPTARMDAQSAQRLMDQLWNCGLRPSEGTGSAGAMQAVQRHLEDMRTLVFKAIK